MCVLGSWPCVCVCANIQHAFVCVSIVVLYVFIRCTVHIARWTDGRCMGVISGDLNPVFFFFLIVITNPDKYHETCRVQLWSEVNTCLCWHKHTLNRCVIQVWGQIAAQRNALKSGVTAIGVKRENDMNMNMY